MFDADLSTDLKFVELLASPSVACGTTASLFSFRLDCREKVLLQIRKARLMFVYVTLYVGFAF